MVSAELQLEIEQFLFAEVRLLSEHRYREWLTLFTDDARYWVPVRETVPGAVSTTGVAADGELANFDDDKSFLTARVERLYSELAHAERPASRVRYFITNVHVEPMTKDEFKVNCNLLVFQSRLEKTQSFYVGSREDVLRRVDGAWRIAVRKTVLDQTLMPRSISIFI